MQINLVMTGPNWETNSKNSAICHPVILGKQFERNKIIQLNAYKKGYWEILSIIYEGQIFLYDIVNFYCKLRAQVIVIIINPQLPTLDIN